jgi:hypothetical protein
MREHLNLGFGREHRKFQRKLPGEGSPLADRLFAKSDIDSVLDRPGPQEPPFAAGAPVSRPKPPPTNEGAVELVEPRGEE